MSSLVTVMVFDHPTDAHIANGQLESAGILTHLQNIHHASASWLMSNALGGIRLQVPEAYASQAQSILESESALPSPFPQCKNCGGSDFSRSNAGWRLAFFLFHFVGIPWRWGDGDMICDDCGLRREDAADDS